MTTYEKLVQKIHEVCPELMELKFGCRVKADHPLLKEGILIEKIATNKLTRWSIFYPDMDENIAGSYGSKRYNISWHNPLKPDKEVLGASIQLHHVLKTINKAIQGKYVGYDNPLTIELTTWGMFIGNYYNWEEEPQVWDMDKDLSHQSPEVIEFLYNIICK